MINTLPSESPRETLDRAKQQFIAAAYESSPLRTVERQPLLSVTAVAGIAIAATVIVGEPLIRSVGGGLATHGLGIISTLLRSQFAGSLLTQVGQKFAGSQSHDSH